jgi:hypothetical protein
MRLRLIVLSLLIPLSMKICVAQARDLSMKKHDLTSAGFSIITSDDPSYETELRQLGFGSNPDALAIKPFSVLLKNTSSRSVVAFAIKWTISDALGNTLSRSFNYIQPNALLDGGKAKRERMPVEHQIRPGASRLVTVNGMVRSPEELHDLAAGSFVGSVKGVDLDLAIFDDGEAVGPNELGLMERFAAFVDAEQDLMREVGSRMSIGEEVKKILADIRSRLAPDTREVPVTPAAIYDHNLRIYLDELEATTENAGTEATRNIVAYRKYDVRPNIHRLTSPSGTEAK